MTERDLLNKHKSQFSLFASELLKWNEQINLTAITNPKDIETKHFLDSLTLLPFIPVNAKTLVDVGSGAGFPGIPIAIARPDISVTLIESTGKKAKFLEHIVEVLGLKNVEVVCARAEEVAKHPDYSEKYDVGVARAVAKLDKLAGFVLPLLKSGGLFLAQKSEKENLEESTPALLKFGGKIESIEKIKAEGLTDRVIAIIRKN